MPERDAVVRAHDVSVRQRGTRQDYAASDDGSRLTQECSTIDLRRFTHVWLRYTKRLVMLSGMCVSSQGIASLKRVQFHLQAVRSQGQRAQPHIARIKNGIGDCRSQPDHGALARARRWKILAVEQHRLKHRNIAETRYA